VTKLVEQHPPARGPIRRAEAGRQFGGRFEDDEAEHDLQRPPDTIGARQDTAAQPPVPTSPPSLSRFVRPGPSPGAAQAMSSGGAESGVWVLP